ncbi:MAG: type II toxin-antitoxin system RelE/ParE family toxin [Deltaproteobacteria bacterium]|nr:type II toxin-antitoxin system RelE/ParE family toxin [Deltaproteobacteria bacterium]
MHYKIEFTPSAEKAFRKLPKNVQRIARDRIDALAEDPRSSFATPLRWGLKGLWKIRIVDYRIAYTIEDKKLIVLVVCVGDRK